jgi:hypothetical protein
MQKAYVNAWPTWKNKLTNHGHFGCMRMMLRYFANSVTDNTRQAYVGCGLADYD